MKAVQVLLRVLLLPFALTAVATAADEAPPEGWQVYRSVVGGYQVLLPEGKILEMDPVEKLPDGTACKLYPALTVSNEIVYKSLFCEWPPGFLPTGRDKRDLMDVLLGPNGLAPGRKYLNRRKFESAGLPAAEVVYEKRDKNNTKEVVDVLRLYQIDDRRTYAFVVTVPKEKYPSADADRFLNSFKRWEPPAAVKAELAAETAAQAKWATFTSKEGNFSVSLPGNPEASTVNATLGGSPVAMSLVRVAFAPDRQYAVRFADLPAASIAVRDPKQGLDQARDALLKEVGGKVVSERRAGLGRYAGRHVEAVGTGKVPRGGTPLPAGTRVQVRLFLVKNRLFEVIRTVPKGDNGDPAPFFDSFKTKS